MNGSLSGGDTVETAIILADSVYMKLMSLESINEPQKSEIKDKSVNKELLDALEMVHAYLDQLNKDGLKLPNIEIIQGSNLSAIQMAKKAIGVSLNE